MSKRWQHVAVFVLAAAVAGLGELAKTSHASWVAAALAALGSLQAAFGKQDLQGQ